MDKGWRKHIVDRLKSIPNALIIAKDPDGLLTEERVSSALEVSGYEVIVLDDPIELWYSYETRFRGERNPRSLIVVLSSERETCRVPFPLEKKARQVDFSLADLFPKLSYPVISRLDKGDLDRLWEAYTKVSEPLGENLTKDFLLDEVFDIIPGKYTLNERDLLLALMRRHYRNRKIPEILNERYLASLRANPTFENWPLETIVPDRHEFLRFLQQRWPFFLEDKLGLKVADAPTPPAADINIPFLDEDVRTLLDNFFLEGLLTPAVLDSAQYHRLETMREPWAKLGIHIDEEERIAQRTRQTLLAVEDAIPQKESSHDEWVSFAMAWGRLKMLVHGASTRYTSQRGDDEKRALLKSYLRLQDKVDRTFTQWLFERFSVLHNQPSVPPVMVHHVPRFLASLLAKKPSEKVALVVVDGLAMDQWAIIKEEISKVDPGVRFRDSGVFAWIPTLTNVSRQSLFGGKIPMFLGSLKSTSGEASLWKAFWKDRGLPENQIAYGKVRGRSWSGAQEYLAEGAEGSQPDEDEEVHAAANGDLEVLQGMVSCTALGLVVGKVDRIAHGIRLGTGGMHNQVRQWAAGGYLGDLVKFLLRSGFRVFLTSDHGNTEAIGCGDIQEGTVAEVRGERVRIYDKSLLRQATRDEFPNALPWPPVGLPQDYLPLLAPGRTAFIRTGETRVCHGGISIDEVIVPFSEITLTRNG